MGGRRPDRWDRRRRRVHRSSPHHPRRSGSCCHRRLPLHHAPVERNPVDWSILVHRGPVQRGWSLPSDGGRGRAGGPRRAGGWRCPRRRPARSTATDRSSPSGRPRARRRAARGCSTTARTLSSTWSRAPRAGAKDPGAGRRGAVARHRARRSSERCAHGLRAPDAPWPSAGGGHRRRRARAPWSRRTRQVVAGGPSVIRPGRPGCAYRPAGGVGPDGGEPRAGRGGERVLVLDVRGAEGGTGPLRPGQLRWEERVAADLQEGGRAEGERRRQLVQVAGRERRGDGHEVVEQPSWCARPRSGSENAAGTSIASVGSGRADHRSACAVSTSRASAGVASGGRLSGRPHTPSRRSTSRAAAAARRSAVRLAASRAPGRTTQRSHSPDQGSSTGASDQSWPAWRARSGPASS